MPSSLTRSLALAAVLSSTSISGAAGARINVAKEGQELAAAVQVAEHAEAAAGVPKRYLMMPGDRPCGKDNFGFYGIISMTFADCKRVKGGYGGAPKDTDWIGCHLNFCTDGIYSAAAGTCAKQVAYGYITTTTKDCIAMKGGYNGSPKADDWIACHLNWCEDGVYAPAGSAGASSPNKIAYGYLSTTAAQCTAVGGGMNGSPGMADWVPCHLNWLSNPEKCALTGQKPRGYWQFLDYTNGGLTLTYEVGVQSSTERETTESWERGVEVKVGGSMDIGPVESSLEVTGSSTWASTTAVRQAFSTSTTETNQKAFSKGGAFWQWQVDVNDACGLATIRTRSVVQTENVGEPPCCPLGMALFADRQHGPCVDDRMCLCGKKCGTFDRSPPAAK